MNSIQCTYCDGEIRSLENGSFPEECPHCLTPLPSEEKSKAAAGEVSLQLICQKTGGVIQGEPAGDTILGREKTGREILGNVAQVSRAHCRIRRVESGFVVTDLGSTNGTFLGPEKIDCAKNPEQPLRNNDLLYLGREPFLIKLSEAGSGSGASSPRQAQADYASSGASSGASSSRGNSSVLAEPVVETQTPAESSRSFECENCRSYVSQVPEFTCPSCNTYNNYSL